MTARPDRSHLNTHQIVESLWTHLGLPPKALSSLILQGEGVGLSSSFRISEVAQATIGLSALTAAQFHALRENCSVPRVHVDQENAVLEFKSVNLHTLNGRPPSVESHPIGEYHKTADGWVLIHDSFQHHIQAALDILCLPWDATLEEIDRKILQWKSADLEAAGMRRGAVIAALRDYNTWDAMPQGKVVYEYPILIRKIADGPPVLLKHLPKGQKKCLRGIRAVDMTHVIAGPLAGRTLAAHGADVLWITSPNMERLPAADLDCSRGKRAAQLDLNREKDRVTLDSILKESHVWINGYRPGGMESKGFSVEAVSARSTRGIICASMSAWGSQGPWSLQRGFDSIIQTASGGFVSEAEHFGAGESTRYLPTQILDYAAGFLLASGITAALYRQAKEGGSYAVEVSLAGTMDYVRSLGQHTDKRCFQLPNPRWQGEVTNSNVFEIHHTTFGELRSVKHAATIQGLEVGYERIPEPQEYRAVKPPRSVI